MSGPYRRELRRRQVADVKDGNRALSSQSSSDPHLNYQIYEAREQTRQPPPIVPDCFVFSCVVSSHRAPGDGSWSPTPAKRRRRRRTPRPRRRRACGSRACPLCWEGVSAVVLVLVLSNPLSAWKSFVAEENARTGTVARSELSRFCVSPRLIARREKGDVGSRALCETELQQRRER